MVKSVVYIVLAFLLFSLPGLAQPVVDDLGYRGGSIPGLEKPAQALHFLLLGDWGRNGDNYQKEVATAMGKAGHDLDASFTVVVGDNFYPYGVQSTQDHQWLTSFENIYTAQSLYNKWYVVLGNHDYISNPQAQVDYTNISARWEMPSRYYARKFRIPGDTLQTALFVFLDTDPFEKKMRGNPPSEKYPDSATTKQEAWLNEVLADTTVQWKIVVGHHPIYTGGWRGTIDDTRNMRNLLEPIFKKYKVDLYLCGHEHHLEYTYPGGYTHYIISGAGSEAREAAVNPDGGEFAAGVQGFATLSLMQNSCLLQFIDYKEEIIFKKQIEKASKWTIADF